MSGSTMMHIHRLKKTLLIPFEFPMHMGIYSQRVFFGVAFSLFLFIQWQGHVYILDRDISVTDLILMILKAVVFTFIGVKLLFQKYDLLRIAIITICSFFVLLSAAHSHDNTLLWTFLFIIAAQNVDLKTIGCACVSAAFCIIALILIVTYHHRSVEFIDSRDLQSIRFSLGFSHPNLAALFVFMLVMGLYFLLEKRLVAVFMVSLSGLIVIYILLSSRTEVIGLVSFIGFLPLIYLRQQKKNLRIANIIDYLICLLCDVLCIVSFLASFFYRDGSETFRLLNKLFSGRLKLLNGYLHGGGITPFGRSYSGFSTGNFNSFGDEVNFIADNFYVRSVLLYGVISGGMLILFFLWLQWYLAVKHSSDLYAFSVPLIMGITESLALFVDKNLMLFLISKLLYRGLEEADIMQRGKHKLS